MEWKWTANRAMKSLFSFLKQVFTSKYLAFVLRVYVGVIFIVAAMSKLPYPAEFVEALAAYRIMPYWSVNMVAVVLPWVELICGLFLIIGFMTRAVASIIGAMLVTFIIAITINLVRGTPISCGCFDSVGAELSWFYVLRDTIWLVLTFQIIFFDKVLQLKRDRLLSFKRKRKNLSVS